MSSAARSLLAKHINDTAYLDVGRITLSDPLLYACRTIFGSLTPYMGTPSFQRWAIDMLPWPKLREAKAMSDIMWNTSQDILANTKKCLAEGAQSEASRVGGREDILSIFGELVSILGEYSDGETEIHP